ncbi:MAG: hypothetical protein RL653_2284 [Pseudomonadota bacterium]|jgi:hypothetical protein
MRKVLLSAAVLLSVPVLPGCIVEAPTSAGSSQPPAAPGRPGAQGALQVRVGANLGNKAELVGYSLDTPQVVPGQPSKFTLGFRVLEPLPDDAQVFVHVEDADGRAERMNVDHKLGGGQVSPSTYKKGDLVRDEFQVFLAPGVEARALNVYVGLWSSTTDERFKLLNPDAVRSDGRDRVLLAQVPVAP